MKIFKILISIFVVIVSILFLALTLRGSANDRLLYQEEKSTQLGGPFEASNSTARYALTESIVLDKSFNLSYNLAKFSAPDVVLYKGKFMSIFTPGVSIIGVPFYVLGLSLGYPQVFTYLSVALFALINIFLIAKLAQKLGASFSTGLLSGFLFVFATNGLTYAQSFTQHHMSTTFILLAVLNALEVRTWKRDLLFGLYFGVSILLDVPNPLMLFPVLLFVFLKHFSITKLKTGKVRFLAKFSFLWLGLGILLFILGFAYYNWATTGSFTKVAQNIGRSGEFSDLPPSHSVEGPPEIVQESLAASLNLPFSSRKQLEGVYTLYVSDERSWLYYSPVVLLGVPALILLYRNEKTKRACALILSVVAVNALVYSMFGDPWGGWAFGPRYLIPIAALMLATSAVLIEKYKRKLVFFILFIVLAIISTYINILGVTTTSLIPPKVEAVNLASHIPYTWQYNEQLMNGNQIASLVYNAWYAKSISGEEYVIILTALVSIVIFGLYVFSLIEKQTIKK